ncbi:alpha/beta hydrolase family protein [Aquirufa nivalisilvae]|uniref:alpha/beta hydrolase family protein n=1 Tax=Aquirufa nivalisilvae TaxID=2516557 RepID=UPI0022A93F8B|nr:acetylxylan esterase [Aquirufa nivalisilvae]MCZ2478774.1 acetylxylan esterase [Aquirufa nivalisilvae]
MKYYLSITLFVSSLLSFGSWAQIARTAEQDSILAERNRKTQADYQQMLEQLNIQSIRPGVNGSNPQAPNAANYDESKANIYPNIPVVLQLNNGKKVDSKRAWNYHRKPEIVEDFEREIYGRIPDNIPPISWKIISTENKMMAGFPVEIQKLVGTVDNKRFPSISVQMEVTIGFRKDIKKAMPAIMELAWVFPPGMNRPPAPANEIPWTEQVIAKGWAFIQLNPTTVQADHGAGLKSGIIGLMNRGEYRKADDWGSLRAWAWGASKVLDYLETMPQIKYTHVGITGHSRYGKAAAVAMAFDSRFAIGYICSSGAGGLKLYRRNYGELIENVAAKNEYHWMAGNFLKYAGPLQWNDLPIDAHELIALCAPRPIYIGVGGNGDSWADPYGMYLAGKEASPVYELLGKKGLVSDSAPRINEAKTQGEIAFRMHDKGHVTGPNWPNFIEFASKYLK